MVEAFPHFFAAFEERNIQAYLIGPRARELASGHSIAEGSSFDLTVDTSLSDIEQTFRELLATPGDPR